MTSITAWVAAGITAGVLVAYELALLWKQRRSPATLARAAHANLREEWFAALSRQPGSEILAVQTPVTEKTPACLMFCFRKISTTGIVGRGYRLESSGIKQVATLCVSYAQPT